MRTDRRRKGRKGRKERGGRERRGRRTKGVMRFVEGGEYKGKSSKRKRR
jgi:hypothetical protein